MGLKRILPFKTQSHKFDAFEFSKAVSNSMNFTLENADLQIRCVCLWKGRIRTRQISLFKKQTDTYDVFGRSRYRTADSTLWLHEPAHISSIIKDDAPQSMYFQPWRPVVDSRRLISAAMTLNGRQPLQ
jgi:hypothetical protein